MSFPAKIGTVRMSKSVEDLASLQQQQDEKLKTSKPNASSPKGFSLTSSMESMSSTAKLGKTEETQENLLKHMWKGHKDDFSIKTQKGEITTSPHKFDDKELSILKLSLGSAYKSLSLKIFVCFSISFLFELIIRSHQLYSSCFRSP
jgi:hypothetical protein